MPKYLEAKLAREADKLHLKGERRRAYIFATLRRIEKAKERKRAGKRDK